MSANMACEQEWEQAKSEMSKLAGHTVHTIGRPTPNKILETYAEGILVQRSLKDGSGIEARKKLPSPQFIQWEEIKDRYCRLKQEGELWPEQQANNPRKGSSIKAILATLSTARKCKRGRTTILCCVPDGKPPTLRDNRAPLHPVRES